MAPSSRSIAGLSGKSLPRTRSGADIDLAFTTAPQGDALHDILPLSAELI
jgi:hypothetical protein